MNNPHPTDLANLQQPEITVTVKTASFSEEVEARAQNMFVSLKMQTDAERLNKAVNERVAALVAEAKLPGPMTEAQVLKQLEDNIYGQLQQHRLNFLAETAAKARFFEAYPDMVKKAAEAAEINSPSPKPKKN